MEAAQSSGVSERAGGPRYSRHSPKSTLLYQIVERHYPRLLETLGDCARSLPRHVQREFEDYLECGLGQIGARLARRSVQKPLTNCHGVHRLQLGDRHCARIGGQ